MIFVRNPRLLAAAVAVFCGYLVDSSLYLVLLLESSRLESSIWVTAIVLANLIPPIITAPFLGWLVDRFSTRTVWSLGLLVSSLAVGGMWVVASPLAVVILAAVQAVVSVAIGSAVFKMLPLLTEGGNQSAASSIAVGSFALASVLGPPGAAILHAEFGGKAAYLTLSVLYVSLAAIIWLAAPKGGVTEVESASWTEITRGFSIVRNTPAIKSYLPLVIGIIVATSIEGVAGVFYLQSVANNQLMFGVMLACWAAGSLVGSMTTGKITSPQGPSKLLLAGGALVAAAILVEGLVPFESVICTVFLLGGFGNAIHNVGVRDLVYESVPTAEQGRVWAVIGAMFSTAAAFGNFLGTPNGVLSAQSLVVGSGILGLSVVLVYVLRSANKRRKVTT